MVYQDFHFSHSSNTPKSRFRLAPVLDRFLAQVFDVVLFTPVFGFILANLFRKIEMMYFTSPNSMEFMVFLFVAVIFSFFLCILFQTLFLILLGATPGKFFFKVQVVNVHEPKTRLRFSQALLRSFLWACEVLCFGLPFLEVASDPSRRPLHDRAAGTVVITLKKQGDQGPSALETHFVRRFLLMISLGTFVWGIFFVGHFYKMAAQGEFKKGELERDEYLCTSVSENLMSQEARIDKALALFLADAVSEECLAAEADFVLWTPNESEKAWAYLAKGMVKKYDTELYEAYLNRTCDIDEDGEACAIAKFQGDPLKNEIPKESRTASVLRVTQDFEKGRYSEAEKEFLKLSQVTGFESFAQSGLVKSYWAQNKLERSKGAYQNVVHQMSRSNQMELAAWVCHEELDRGCSSEAIEACEDLKESYKANRGPVQESFIALALIREKECRKTGAVDLVQFQTIFRERKDVYDYVRAISEHSDLGSDQKNQLLESLAFRKESVRPQYLRRLALQQWVEHAKSEEDFQKITQFLKDKKIHDLSWVKIYEKAMKTFVRMRAEKPIREVVQLPSEDLVHTHDLMPLQIQAHYLAKDYDKAWGELQGLQQSSRAPASSETLTLDFIRQALGKHRQAGP